MLKRIQREWIAEYQFYLVFIILRNMIQTAKDIGFETLCEGVETEAQERAVIKAGCDLLQGYYYYRPLPVAQLEKLLDRGTQE